MFFIPLLAKLKQMAAEILLKPAALEADPFTSTKKKTKNRSVQQVNILFFLPPPLSASVQKIGAKKRGGIVGADGQKEEAEGEYYVKSCPRYTVA